MSGFFGRLRDGLQRSTQKFGDGLAHVFVRRPLDDSVLDELEELLIGADLGTAVASRVIERFRATRWGAEVTHAEIRTALAEEVSRVLAPVAIPFTPDPARRPHVVLVVGVNGTGKTTTIGKMALSFGRQGRKVMMVAGDTFRAAAVEQLQVWGERVGAPVISGPANTDAAGLAYKGLEDAQKAGADLLLIDTAGRLHNKAALMEELAKIIRVLRKFDPSAPHSVLLVLDATTGQNAVEQVRVFKEMVDVTGLVVTKLDGSARGGVVVSLAETYKLPLHAVGVGEKAEDLRAFDAGEFARGLVGETVYERP